MYKNKFYLINTKDKLENRVERKGYLWKLRENF